MPHASWPCRPESTAGPNSEARWRGNPHDKLSHADETEGDPRDQIAADFRTSEESGRKSLLLPLLSLLPLPLVTPEKKPTAGLIPDPGCQSGGRVFPETKHAFSLSSVARKVDWRLR
jgi:hypothetical protein